MRDKSRSVNSIDVVFNFDCVGFTGTPFIDNYPTFAYISSGSPNPNHDHNPNPTPNPFIDNYPTFDYISSGRSDAIPQMIDRSFYAYSAEVLRFRMGSLLSLC